MNPERKYVAISIKHTAYKWKFGMPCFLWGYHQTEDDQPRCFSGYTFYLSRAERYAIGEHAEHGYDDDIVKPEPVKLTPDFCKRWKAYDTVLVDAEEYSAYCKLSGVDTEAPEAWQNPETKI